MEKKHPPLTRRERALPDSPPTDRTCFRGQRALQGAVHHGAVRPDPRRPPAPAPPRGGQRVPIAPAGPPAVQGPGAAQLHARNPGAPLGHPQWGAPPAQPEHADGGHPSPPPLPTQPSSTGDDSRRCHKTLICMRLVPQKLKCMQLVRYQASNSGVPDTTPSIGVVLTHAED